MAALAHDPPYARGQAPMRLLAAQRMSEFLVLLQRESADPTAAPLTQMDVSTLPYTQAPHVTA